MKNTIIIPLLALLFSANAFSQAAITINVNASTSTGTMPPIWRDHYENHLMDGYGDNPATFGNHILYTTDAAFTPAMTELKPRFIRISIGRLDNPPTTDYSSTNTGVLRNLKYEFYKGVNNIAAANNLSNYNFAYIDSAITKIKSFGAEPFITMDYMPFTLSRDTTPDYQAAMALVYNLAYDNSIRNSPPLNNAVYGRVMYQFIKHCYQTYGVKYFEHWNEPDQMWANPVMIKFFWKGDEYELYNAYAAIADEVTSDANLANNIKLGGCSFAFYSLFNIMPTNFLNAVKTNNKKFDFLSFHPYSDVQYAGGYDTAKVNLAIQWRNTYVPNAELICAEWGRLDANTTVWGDLDYGLNKARHIIDMLNRGITMSHDVCLFDDGASNDNYAHLGMYRVGPVVPKPPAYVFYNFNKMNDALNRLPLTINNGMFALAGKSNTNNKIVIVFPAGEPVSSADTVTLSVTNLSWGSAGYYIYRYELTEQSYTNNIKYNLTYSSSGTGSAFSNSFAYTSNGNSGRFIVWEISSSLVSGINNINTGDAELFFYPNPANSVFVVETKNPALKIKSTRIYNLAGQKMFEEQYSNPATKKNIQTRLINGVYIAIVETNKGSFTKKLVVKK